VFCVNTTGNHKLEPLGSVEVTSPFFLACQYEVSAWTPWTNSKEHSSCRKN